MPKARQVQQTGTPGVSPLSASQESNTTSLRKSPAQDINAVTQKGKEELDAETWEETEQEAITEPK